MPAPLTEKEFSQHLNSSFQVKLPDRELSLELVEVKGYHAGADEQSGLERFSIFFTGPGDIRLPQQIYQLVHERMGEFEIFLVPVSGDDKGYRYEAVFNYFKK
ncbi:MAG: hypothetical protein AABM67_13985 [Acidobacteriota bacterium]